MIELQDHFERDPVCSVQWDTAVSALVGVKTGVISGRSVKF